MKYLLKFIFNVLWFVFAGLVLGIYNLICALISCILIIPIFIGIPKVYLRAAKLCFAPAGKEVVLHFDQAPIRNILWLIFGGGFSFVYYYLYGAILCCTIIGIPVGLQLFKFGKFMIFPFEASVNYIGE